MAHCMVTLMFNASLPFSMEHAPHAVAVAVLGTVIPEKREHEKCPGTVTMPPLGYGIWYGSLRDGYGTCTVRLPRISPCETPTENYRERRYCPRKDTINRRPAIATITLCTRCKRPELAGDEDIIALSVSLYTSTPFIASRNIFRRQTPISLASLAVLK